MVRIHSLADSVVFSEGFLWKEADLLELVDKLDLGSNGLSPVQVQVLHSALRNICLIRIRKDKG